MSDKALQGKKIAMIIAQQDFRDEEYFIPKSIFLKEGAKVVTFSSAKGNALGSYGGVVEAEEAISSLKVDNFDALVFIGGSGAAGYMDDEVCHLIAKKVVDRNKVIAAICIAPTILARSGILKNKKATVWSSPMDKSGVKILKDAGAIYQEVNVVRDGNIVTGNGPLAARKFAEVIEEVLTNN